MIEQLKGDARSETDVSRRLLKSTRQRFREFELILRCLSEQKTERPTAIQALESNVFGVTTKPKDPLQELEDVSLRQSHHSQRPFLSHCVVFLRPGKAETRQQCL